MKTSMKKLPQVRTQTPGNWYNTWCRNKGIVWMMKPQMHRSLNTNIVHDQMILDHQIPIMERGLLEIRPKLHLIKRLSPKSAIPQFNRVWCSQFLKRVILAQLMLSNGQLRTVLISANLLIVSRWGNKRYKTFVGKCIKQPTRFERNIYSKKLITFKQESTNNLKNKPQNCRTKGHTWHGTSCYNRISLLFSRN